MFRVQREGRGGPYIVFPKKILCSKASLQNRGLWMFKIVPSMFPISFHLPLPPLIFRENEVLKIFRVSCCYTAVLNWRPPPPPLSHILLEKKGQTWKIHAATGFCLFLASLKCWTNWKRSLYPAAIIKSQFTPIVGGKKLLNLSHAQIMEYLWVFSWFPESLYLAFALLTSLSHDILFFIRPQSTFPIFTLAVERK